MPEVEVKPAETNPDVQDGRKSYDENYVKSLREESRKRLERSQDAERERDELRAKVEAREKKELEEQGKIQELLAQERKEREREKAELSEKLSASDRRFVLAEARALAIRAGIIDADDVKAAIDVNDLRIDDDGNVSGLKDKIEALKESKPHWFKGADDVKDAKKRAVVTPDRKDGAPSGKSWQTASDAEMRAELAKYGVR